MTETIVYVTRVWVYCVMSLSENTKVKIWPCICCSPTSFKPCMNIPLTSYNHFQIGLIYLTSLPSFCTLQEEAANSPQLSMLYLITLCQNQQSVDRSNFVLHLLSFLYNLQKLPITEIFTLCDTDLPSHVSLQKKKIFSHYFRNCLRSFN